MSKVVTCTTKDLAEIYGCSVQYIGELVKDGRLPRPIKQNCHDMKKACMAIVEIIKEESSETQLNLAAEKLRLTKYQAKKAQIEVAESLKVLIPAKTACEIFFEFVRLTRDQILNIPSRISPILAAEKDTKKTNEILTKELHQSLESLPLAIKRLNLPDSLNIRETAEMSN